MSDGFWEIDLACNGVLFSCIYIDEFGGNSMGRNGVVGVVLMGGGGLVVGGVYLLTLGLRCKFLTAWDSEPPRLT